MWECSVNRHQNDWKKSELNGSVKSILKINTINDPMSKNYKITYNPRGYVSEWTVLHASGRVHSTAIYMYDEGDNLVTIEHKYANGRIARTIMHYDEYRNRTSRLEYNSNGRLTEYSYTTEFEYNEKGDLISERWYDVNGHLTDTMIHRYDDIGEEIEVNELISGYKRFVKFDKKGKLLTQVVISLDKKGVQKYKYIFTYTDLLILCEEYDARNNFIEKSVSPPDGGLPSEVPTEYTYDEYDNWVEEISRNCCRKRMIEYY